MMISRETREIGARRSQNQAAISSMWVLQAGISLNTYVQHFQKGRHGAVISADRKSSLCANHLTLHDDLDFETVACMAPHLCAGTWAEFARLRNSSLWRDGFTPLYTPRREFPNELCIWS